MDHVEPAHGVVVAALRGLESTVVRKDSGLGREAAHPEQHVQDFGKVFGLVVIVRRTLVQWPLWIVLVAWLDVTGK